MIEILDFYSDWCRPCQQLSKILEEIQEENPEINITKLNIDDDDNLELVTELKIRNIPYLLIKKDGEVINKSVGLKTKEELLKLW